MAKQAVYDYSTTASSNSDFDGTDSSGATGKVKDGDNYARSIASHIKGFANDLGGINTVAGTGDAITITLSAAPSALVDGMRLTFNASAANTTNVTLTVTPNGGASFGSKKVLKWAAGVETALSANDIPAANALIELIYDTARDTAAGAWMLLGTAVAAATTSASGIVELATVAEAATGTDAVRAVTPSALGQLGYALAAAVGSSALTVSLKHISGADPSSTNPVLINFRNATAATGTPDPLAATAATSIVISSGSTMGFTSAVIGRLWVVAFNDAGTLRLGLVNALSGTSIMALRDGIYSSTAEGGAGAADSAQVIYTGTAVTSKAMTVLGYIEATEATAGTWATAPSLIKIWQLGDAMPGDVVQTKRTAPTAMATGTTNMALDDTIPQSNEGDQFMSLAITPMSPANLLRIHVELGLAYATGTGNIISGLYQDSTANALMAKGFTSQGSNAVFEVVFDYLMQAATSISTTFKVRSGGVNSSTLTFNGQGGARILGGVAASELEILEVMA